MTKTKNDKIKSVHYLFTTSSYLML